MSDKPQNWDLTLGPEGEAGRPGLAATESLKARSETENPAGTNRIMEEVCERERKHYDG